MSNPYSAEILSTIANRITRDRLLVADAWVRERMVKYGSGALAPDAMSLIGSPVERAWLSEHGTTLDAIRRCHDESSEAVYTLQRPARWLIRGLWWALAEPTLSSAWLDDDLLRYEPGEFEMLAKALFAENSVSLSILLEHLRTTDPTHDRMRLLGGALWSLGMLSVWAPVLLAHLDHLDRLAIQPQPRDLAVELFSDLRADLLGDSRFEAFRDLSRRRQARTRDGQGGDEGESIGDIDLAGAVREIVERVQGDDDGQGGES